MLNGWDWKHFLSGAAGALLGYLVEYFRAAGF